MSAVCAKQASRSADTRPCRLGEKAASIGPRNASAEGMMSDSKATGVRLSERVIPIPKSISPEAQAFFEYTAQQPSPPQNYPSPTDKAGWRTYVDAFNRQ